MVLAFQPPVVGFEKGATGSNFHHFGNNVWIIHAEAAPTDGTSGDGAGWAGPGSLYIDRTASTGNHYRQTGTLASPTWTIVA